MKHTTTHSRNIMVAVFAILLLTTSCKTSQVGVPASLKEHGEKLHVKGTSVSVFGHKIKIEGFGEGRMYSGFTNTYGTEKRLFPLYFDLDARMNYISNHFSKSVTKTNSKFSFDFTNNNIYANTYCVMHASEQSLQVKPADFGISLSELYTFSGLIYTNKEAAPWKIDFKGSRNVKDGFDNYVDNVRQTDGILTNDKELIDVKVVRIKTMKEDGTSRPTLFPVAAGYEFMKDGQRLAFVDLFDRNIWVSKNVDELTRVILVSAATSILVKQNAG